MRLHLHLRKEALAQDARPHCTPWFPARSPPLLVGRLSRCPLPESVSNPALPWPSPNPESAPPSRRVPRRAARSSPHIPKTFSDRGLSLPLFSNYVWLPESPLVVFAIHVTHWPQIASGTRQAHAIFG